MRGTGSPGGRRGPGGVDRGHPEAVEDGGREEAHRRLEHPAEDHHHGCEEQAQDGPGGSRRGAAPADGRDRVENAEREEKHTEDEIENVMREVDWKTNGLMRKYIIR